MADILSIEGYLEVWITLFMLKLITLLFSRVPAIFRYTGNVLDWYRYGVHPYIIPWVYAVGLTAQTGSIYCTLGVTVERYIVVCWPLR